MSDNYHPVLYSPSNDLVPFNGWLLMKWQVRLIESWIRQGADGWPINDNACVNSEPSGPLV